MKAKITATTNLEISYDINNENFKKAFNHHLEKKSSNGINTFLNEISLHIIKRRNNKINHIGELSVLDKNIIGDCGIIVNTVKPFISNKIKYENI